MDFIESPDVQQTSPPYAFPGMAIRGFALEATLGSLQDYCDRFLNIDPRYHFRALVPLVYLCINTYPKMYIEGQEELGFTTQDEYFLMFPVVRFDALGFILLPAELTWAFPYIGVNNSTSAITGQMVLGFPKLLGEIAATTTSDGSFSASVAMPGFTSLGRDSAQAMLPIIDLGTGSGRLDGTASGLPFPWSLLTLDKSLDALDDVLLLLLEVIDPGLFSATMLKQVRDAEAPSKACYHSLVRANWTLANTSAPTVFDQARVDIFDNLTLPIAEALGLQGGVSQIGAPNGKGLRFEALFGFGMTTDMVFGDITNL